MSKACCNAWAYGAMLEKIKKRKQRRELDVSRCFEPLVQWIQAWWSADQPRLVLALDATTLKKSFQWMGEMTRLSTEIVAEAISNLKEELNVFLA